MTLRERRFTRYSAGSLVIVTTAFLAFFSLFITTPKTYAADPSCQMVAVGCSTASPVQQSPADQGLYSLTRLPALTWTQANDDDRSVTFRVCVSSNTTMNNAACVDTQDLSIASTEPGLLGAQPADGTWYWQVTALAGGILAQNGASDVRSFVLDSTNPTITTFAVDKNDIGGTQNTVRISGQVSDSQSLTCQLTLTNPDGSAGGSTPCAVDGTGNVTGSWTATGSSGDYNLTLTVTDGAGNSSTAVPLVIHVDNDPPKVTFTNQDVLTPGSTTPGTNATDAHSDGLIYSWTQNKDNPQVLDFQADGANPTFTPTIAGLYHLTLTITDALGNQAAYPFDFTYEPNIAPITAPTDQPIVPPNSPTTEPGSDTTVIEGTTATTTPTATRRGDNQDTSPSTNSLGASTIANLVTADPRDKAVVVATNGGWQILVILWYWWLLFVIVMIALFFMIRRAIILRRISLLDTDVA